MAGRPQSASLLERADSSVDQFQKLKRRGEKSLNSHKSRSTQQFLKRVEEDINDSIRSLRAWIAQFEKGSQVDNTSIVETVVKRFDLLDQHVHAASTALRLRLQRRLLLIDFILHKRKRFEKILEQALRDVKDTIGELHNSLKVATIQAKRSTSQKETSQTSNFSEYFRSITTIEPKSLLSSALAVLWRYFPKWKDVEGKVGNADDPGDGMLYDAERVAQAQAVLQDFYQAWTSAEVPASHPPPPPCLPEMGRICLILTGMRQQPLLEDFLHGGCEDKDLPLGKPRLIGVLKPEHIEYASTFATEQFRAVSREWEEGQHLEIDAEEPLPLILEKHYDTGSYGRVYRVRDPVSGDIYARKDQITGSDQVTADARKHLEEETKRLKGLKHRHIVQVVKTYQRGKAYGVLLKPAATSDLQKLLGRNDKNRFFPQKGCRDRVWLRPLLLTAFGCLSYGLAFIHSRNIRHKDVKPANILYQDAQPSNDNTARFLWADFGLAYDFSKSGNSKTRSTKIYSPRYAAPEIVAANRAGHKAKRASVPSALDEIVENGGERLIGPDVPDERLDEHGRAADIFSLGCVFLELLAGLTKEKLPLEKHDPEDEKLMFSHNIPGLLAWSQSCLERHAGDELGPLFSLAVLMISPKPEDRPLTEAVVAKLGDTVAGTKYFCRACWSDIVPTRSSPNSLFSSPSSQASPRSSTILNQLGSFPSHVLFPSHSIPTLRSSVR